MLGEMKTNGQIVVSDLEAGVGTVLRMKPGIADFILVIAEPTARSIEAARRASSIAKERSHVIVVANRVRSDEDLEAIRTVLSEHEMVVVPDDPDIAEADREGVAPIDAAGDSPGVAAIQALAERLRPKVAAS